MSKRATPSTTPRQPGPHASVRNLWRSARDMRPRRSVICTSTRTPRIPIASGRTVSSLPQSCASSFLRVASEVHGLVDSHPYASLPTRRGVYVADAAANAILWCATASAHRRRDAAAKPVSITANRSPAECTRIQVPRSPHSSETARSTDVVPAPETRVSARVLHLNPTTHQLRNLATNLSSPIASVPIHTHLSSAGHITASTCSHVARRVSPHSAPHVTTDPSCRRHTQPKAKPFH